MRLPVDIHTHRLPQMPGEAIVNCYPETFVPQEGGWYSVGIHPWYVASSITGKDISSKRFSDNFLSLLRHPRVLAVGEAGLDKLANAPMSMQLEIFAFQARLSMELDKPLVIHLVKAVDELLKMRGALRPSNPWIIHGFRGKAALAEEYLKHGFYLSFGEKYQADALRAVPLDHLFIETDESPLPVTGLYEQAAAVRGVSLGKLSEAIRGNISKVFFKQ